MWRARQAQRYTCKDLRFEKRLQTGPYQRRTFAVLFFCIYNCETGGPEVYQLLTLPFGATHSVYSFLRLARLLYTIATRGLYLLTTNFYDDYILASLPGSVESSKNAMELIFMLTGWQFGTDGKKRTMFDKPCKALGVFSFSINT